MKLKEYLDLSESLILVWIYIKYKNYNKERKIFENKISELCEMIK